MAKEATVTTEAKAIANALDAILGNEPHSIRQRFVIAWGPASCDPDCHSHLRVICNQEDDAGAIAPAMLAAAHSLITREGTAHAEFLPDDKRLDG